MMMRSKPVFLEPLWIGLLALTVTIPVWAETPAALSTEAAWKILATGASGARLEAWPCLESPAAVGIQEPGRRGRAQDGLRVAGAFLRRVEPWSEELHAAPLAALEQRLAGLLAVRGAVMGSYCYGNLVVADTLTRVAYVALVERVVAEPETSARLAPAIAALPPGDLPLDRLEALSALEAGLHLPPTEPACASSDSCYRSRLDSLYRGLEEIQSDGWPDSDSLGAYRLLREPLLIGLLSRMVRTDELAARDLPILADYARRQPAKSGGLRADVSEKDLGEAGSGKQYGSRINHSLGEWGVASSLIKSAREGSITFQRGFSFSTQALITSRLATLGSEAALARPSIAQFEPAPLVLRFKNPGEPFVIVRPAPLLMEDGKGLAYPVTVRVSRQGHAEASAIQLVPPGRAKEQAHLDFSLFEVRPGDHELPLAVSASRERPSDPLFSEPGVYSLSVEYRPIPESPAKERRIGERILRATGTAELTVRALTGPDLACWRAIAPSPHRWVLYDPYGAYLPGTKTPDLEATRAWLGSVRARCSESLFRHYLDFAGVLVSRELTQRSGNWHPDAASLTLLESLSQASDFSFQQEARALWELAKRW